MIYGVILKNLKNKNELATICNFELYWHVKFCLMKNKKTKFTIRKVWLMSFVYKFNRFVFSFAKCDLNPDLVLISSSVEYVSSKEDQ